MAITVIQDKTEKTKPELTEEQRLKMEARKQEELRREQIRREKPLVDPVTPEEAFEFSFKKNRDRYNTFPKRLPTMGKKPLPPDEHVRIGMYESKQDLYLLIANGFNECMEQIELLENRIQILENELKNKPK